MRKNKLILISSVVTPAVIGLPMLSAGCKYGSESNVVKVSDYSDQMHKLLSKSITLAGAWADANSSFNKENADKIKVIGATEIISNDGIQVRSNMKQDDINGLCWLFQKAIKASKTDPDLRMMIGGKEKSVFDVYNHSAYSKLNPQSKITFDIDHVKMAYNNITPENGGEYFMPEGDHFVAKQSGQKLKIQFIPSNSPDDIIAASNKLKAYFKKLGFSNVEFNTSINYNAAASALKAKSIDVAFLPADTWGNESGNSLFILQAGRPVQIIDPYKSIELTSQPALKAQQNEKELVEAINNYKTFDSVNSKNPLYLSSEASKRPTTVTEGYDLALKTAVDSIPTNVELPPVGYYRSYIYARTDSDIYKVVTKALAEQGANWKLKWDDVKDMVSYGYTSTTSSASYIYPEQWFIKHFEGFKSFK